MRGSTATGSAGWLPPEFERETTQGGLVAALRRPQVTESTSANPTTDDSIDGQAQGQQQEADQGLDAERSTGAWQGPKV